jgi:cell division protein DivIC
MLKKKKKVLKVLKPFKNIYLLILIAFIIWMTMFDANSWLIHADLNKDIDDLNSKIEFYNSEISKDQKEINTLNSTNGIEKYAREHYKMKKDNHDSLKTTTNE